MLYPSNFSTLTNVFFILNSSFSLNSLPNKTFISSPVFLTWLNGKTISDNKSKVITLLFLYFSLSFFIFSLFFSNSSFALFIVSVKLFILFLISSFVTNFSLYSENFIFTFPNPFDLNFPIFNSYSLSFSNSPFGSPCTTPLNEVFFLSSFFMSIYSVLNNIPSSAVLVCSAIFILISLPVGLNTPNPPLSNFTFSLVSFIVYSLISSITLSTLFFFPSLIGYFVSNMLANFIFSTHSFVFSLYSCFITSSTEISSNLSTFSSPILSIPY